MSEHLTLEVIDEECAMREALDDDAHGSRERFLKTAVFAGGALAAGGILIGGLPKVAWAKPSPKQDADILNLVLLLEFLEAEFYAEASRRGRLRGELRQFSRIVGAHERAHVAFLKKALGRSARKKPTFDFGNATLDPVLFAATATTLEDTGVAAYNGQATNLTRGALEAAATIVSVEARHAAWIRGIIRDRAAEQATDRSQTKAEALRAVRQTGFVKRA